jgi:hypothetical protein
MAAAFALWVGITIPLSEERGKDMGEGEWMKASRLGVAATAGVERGPGVVGRDVPLGRRLNKRRENWDCMSPKEADGVFGWSASREVKESHNAGDSANGEKAGL